MEEQPSHVLKLAQAVEDVQAFQVIGRKVACGVDTCSSNAIAKGTHYTLIVTIFLP